MLSILEKIKQYNNKLEVIQVYVEELDETIYLTPITVAEQHKITRLSPNNKDLEINILIEKVMNKDKQKLFTIEDKEELRKLPLAIINKILSPILNDLSKSNNTDNIEKN